MNIFIKKSYNIIPTDHHLGFQDGGHFEPIFINISVRVQDGIEGLNIINLSMFLCWYVATSSVN